MINVEDKVKLDINDDEIFTITEKSITVKIDYNVNVVDV